MKKFLLFLFLFLFMICLPTYAQRVQLTGDTTYYVSTSGSDANDCSASDSGHACLTIQRTVNLVQSEDLGQFNVTIQVANGTYTMPIGLGPFLGGNVILQGNIATPSNCVISVVGDTAITVSGPVSTTVQGFKILTSTSGNGIWVTANATLTLGPMEYGTCAGYQIFAQHGTVYINSNYKISGNAVVHALSWLQGMIFYASDLTVTLTGTPSFAGGFAYCADLSELYVYPITFTGGATGRRYYAEVNSVINTGGAGANYLPGNSAGSVATGGQYH